jgi:hypothetical protein
MILTPFGLYFQTKMKQDELDCQENLARLENLFYAIFLVSSEQRKLFFNCYNKFRNDKAKKIDFKNIEIKLTKKQWSHVEPQRKSDKAVEFLKVFEDVFTFKYSYEKAYQLLQNLSQYNNILARLAEAYIYMISGNTARTEKLLSEIMNRELMAHAFSSDISTLPIEEQQSHLENIYKKIAKELKDSKILTNLKYYLFYGTSEQFSDSLSDSFHLDKGMVAIRKKYNSVLYGLKFPYVWSVVILKESGQKEYEHYIQNSHVSEKLLAGDFEYLLFLRGMNRLKDYKKDHLLRDMKKLRQSNRVYHRILYFRLLQDQIFYQTYRAHTSEKLGLLVNLKRNLFLKQFKNKKCLEFCLKELIGLGDIKEKFVIEALNIKR